LRADFNPSLAPSLGSCTGGRETAQDYRAALGQSFLPNAGDDDGDGDGSDDAGGDDDDQEAGMTADTKTKDCNVKCLTEKGGDR
jgi:hypothetical protein